MKLRDIFESYDMSKRGTNFSEEELETLYTIIAHQKELDRQDLKHIAAQLNETGKWTRGIFSAELGLARMHVLVHGVAPHGVSERTAEGWMTPSGPMDKFARSKGIDVDNNVKRARRELAGRRAKLGYEDAKNMMADYAKHNRHLITPAVRKYRDKIIADIQAGLTPGEAIQRFVDLAESEQK